MAKKAFFSEEKKQKTFISAVADQFDRSFLVLFFKKGLLAFTLSLYRARRFRMARLTTHAPHAASYDGGVCVLDAVVVVLGTGGIVLMAAYAALCDRI